MTTFPADFIPIQSSQRRRKSNLARKYIVSPFYDTIIFILVFVTNSDYLVRITVNCISNSIYAFMLLFKGEITKVAQGQVTVNWIKRERSEILFCNSVMQNPDSIVQLLANSPWTIQYVRELITFSTVKRKTIKHKYNFGLELMGS